MYFLPRRVTLNSDGEAAELLAHVRENIVPPPALIIVDTLNRNLSGNENSSEDMGAFVRGCDLLRDGTGATVLVVHHKGHGADDRGRGSSVFEAAADTVILCTRDDDRVNLENKWMKDSSEFPPLAMQALEIAPSLVLKPSGVNEGGLKGQRLLLLRTLHDNYTDAGTSHKAWSDATGLANSSFNKALDWLRTNAYVKSEDGKWKVTDAGRMALSTYSTVTPLQPSGAGLIHSTTQGGYVIPPAVEEDHELDLHRANSDSGRAT